MDSMSRRPDAGFTMVEILVALGLIGFGLAGLLAAVPVAMSSVQAGSVLSRATFLANQRLEQVRNAAWTATPANDCLGVSSPATAAHASATCNGVNTVTFPDETNLNNWSYDRSVRVINCGVAPGCGTAPNNITDPAIRLVTVTVTYTPGTTATSSLQLTLLVAQR